VAASYLSTRCGANEIVLLAEAPDAVAWHLTTLLQGQSGCLDLPDSAFRDPRLRATVAQLAPNVKSCYSSTRSW
jgi:hypothetical protein